MHGSNIGFEDIEEAAQLGDFEISRHYAGRPGLLKNVAQAVIGLHLLQGVQPPRDLIYGQTKIVSEVHQHEYIIDWRRRLRPRYRGAIEKGQQLH